MDLPPARSVRRPHGHSRCDVCALSRPERRRLDWARVDRAGAAWRRLQELEKSAKKDPNAYDFRGLGYFDERYALRITDVETLQCN